MLFYITLAIVILLPLVDSLNDAIKLKTKNKNPNKHITFKQQAKIFFKEFFSGAAILAGIATVILFFVAIFTLNFPGNESKTISKETFTLSEDSTIDTASEKNTIKFVVKRDDNFLEVKSVYYEQIFFNTTNIKEIQVENVDQHHTWLFPWALYTDNNVILK